MLDDDAFDSLFQIIDQASDEIAGLMKGPLSPEARNRIDQLQQKQLEAAQAIDEKERQESAAMEAQREAKEKRREADRANQAETEKQAKQAEAERAATAEEDAKRRKAQIEANLDAVPLGFQAEHGPGADSVADLIRGLLRLAQSEPQPKPGANASLNTV